MDGTQYPVSISANGRTLLYAELAVDSFDRAYWLLNLESEETTQLTEAIAGVEARLSPDGLVLAYDSSGSALSQIYVVDVRSGARHAVSSGRISASTPVWTGDGTGLLFVGRAAGSSSVYRLDISRSASGGLEISPPEEQFEVVTNFRLEDTWPDGRLLAVGRERSNAAAGDRDTIRVTLNWFRELERLAPRR